MCVCDPSCQCSASSLVRTTAIQRRVPVQSEPDISEGKEGGGVPLHSSFIRIPPCRSLCVREEMSKLFNRSGKYY